MNIDQKLSIPETLSIYIEEVRFKLAYRLTLLFTIIFAILTIAHLHESTENLITMAIGFSISLSCFVYNFITKKYQIVYWVFSIFGVLITGLALNFLPSTTHYGDFIWMFCAIVLAFFGINNKIGFILLGAAIFFIAFFTFFHVNENIQVLQERTMFQKFSLFTELLAAMFSGIYMIYSIMNFHDYSDKILTEANQKLQSQNELIKAQDLEKTVLVKEVHHRVKNNLQIISSLLRMQSSEITSVETKKHFQEAINRVMSMSLIHEKLYKGASLSNIDLREYIHDLISDLIGIFELEKTIKFQIEIAEVDFNLKEIVPFGLLINELVSNSLKHAFVDAEKGSIDVNIFVKEEKVNFIYKDSGVWKEDSNPGFGLDLIDMLVEQLDGKKLVLKSETGTTYEIIMKS